MDALRELASRTDDLEGVTCAFKCEQPVEIADSLTATHLYRTVQEAVTNALKHARPEHILIALESDNGHLPMVGLSLLGDSIAKIRRLAPYLQSLGVVLTLYSRNERICRQVENMLKNKLKGNLFETKIRVNTKAKAAPSVRKTIFDYENSSKGRGTQDFTAPAKELLSRLEAREEELRSVANA